MMSMVLPYWNRNAATNEAMWLIDKHYRALDLEVLVVDDGSKEEFVPAGEWPFLRVIKLPRKDMAMNPCVPINVGAREARGDILILSNPEVKHHVPVLQEMRAELERTGPMGYVLSACKYDRDGTWHCHSSLVNEQGYRDQYRQPKNSGFHFCAMFYRTLWDKAGGFDEDYRAGSSYDDPDWVNRVASAGGIFRMRDDLVVEHTRNGAESNYASGMLERNKALFFDKWPQ